jgi:AraC family transcriptional regulator
MTPETHVAAWSGPAAVLVDMPDSPLHAYIDAPRLRQLITNLLDNATRYTRPCGRMRIALKTVDGHVVLSVEDNGAFVARLPVLASLAQPEWPGDARPASPPRGPVRGGLAPWQVKRVLDYIEKNLAECIPVGAIAAVVGLCSSHFSRAFKRSLGLPFHLYLMRRRVALAQRLMLNTADSLGTIAVSCGMSDQSHLTRWFRRVVDETPNAWRRAHRGASP